MAVGLWLAHAGAASAQGPEAGPAPAVAADAAATNETAEAGLTNALPPLDPILFSPNWQSVRAQFRKENEQVAARRVRQLMPLVQRSLQEAEQSVTEARRVRNATEIRVAQAYRDTLAGVRDAVTAGSPVPWPESVRPEMRERLKKFRDEFEAASQAADEPVAAVRTAQLTRFADALRAAQQPVPEDIEALYSRWLAEDPPEPGAEKPPDGETPPAEEEAPPPEEVKPPEPPKEYFAESGPADGEWTPVGRWTAEMRGPDLFKIQIFDAREPRTGAQANQVSGQTSVWSWEPIQPLAPGTNYVYRLKRLEGRTAVDVVNWPGPDHPGELAIRTPHASVIPSPVGFELQWAKPTQAEDPAVVEARRELAEKGIDIPIQSRPEGARVGVNGKVYRLPSGEAALTPCTVRLLPGTVRLTLVLDEHVPHDVAEFKVTAGARMNWQFQSELDLPGTSFRVDAKTPWQVAKIEVATGDRIWVIPEGTWVIGERGETCGAAGYDEAKLPHYAAAKTAALRQVAEAPYGALLMRIGVKEKSKPILIEKPLRIVSPMSGVLGFDTNEISESKARRDNRGALSLKIIVIPRKKGTP
jgi:hypothetical protein